MNSTTIDFSLNDFGKTVQFLNRLVEIMFTVQENTIGVAIPKDLSFRLEEVIVRSMEYTDQSLTAGLKNFGRFVVNFKGLKTVDVRGNDFDPKYFLCTDKVEYLL